MAATTTDFSFPETQPSDNSISLDTAITSAREQYLVRKTVLRAFCEMVAKKNRRSQRFWAQNVPLWVVIDIIGSIFGSLEYCNQFSSTTGRCCITLSMLQRNSKEYCDNIFWSIADDTYGIYLTCYLATRSERRKSNTKPFHVNMSDIMLEYALLQPGE